MSRPKAVRYLAISQISMYGFLLVCTLLMPTFLFRRNEGGVSNYGVHLRTVAPYTLAFGSGGVGMILAARAIPREISQKLLKRVLIIIGILLLFVLATTYPYKLNKTFDNVHILAALMLFIAELAVGIWFAAVMHRDKLNGLLLAVLSFGSLLALLTLVGLLHVLFASQIIAGLCFAVLMVRTVSRVIEAPRAKATRQPAKINSSNG